MQIVCWHSGHEVDTFMFHLARLVGVGRHAINRCSSKEGELACR